MDSGVKAEKGRSSDKEVGCPLFPLPAPLPVFPGSSWRWPSQPWGVAGLGAWLIFGSTKLAPAPASPSREVFAVPAVEDDPALPPGVRIDFEDVAESAGVRFLHFDGRVPKPYLMDTTGPGLAWLDYDGDGWMDLFLVQGSAIVGPNVSPPPTSKLYRNEGGGPVFAT